MRRQDKPRIGTGVERIAAERQRQIADLKWTPKHDDDHEGGELALAAVCYAAPDRVYVRDDYAAGVQFNDPWPWEGRGDSRPHDGNVLKDRTRAEDIRLLEKAGALIAAEIDRLLRIAAKSKKRVKSKKHVPSIAKAAQQES
jgi:hypothetical protein